MTGNRGRRILTLEEVESRRSAIERLAPANRVADAVSRHGGDLPRVELLGHALERAVAENA